MSSVKLDFFIIFPKDRAISKKPLEIQYIVCNKRYMERVLVG